MLCLAALMGAAAAATGQFSYLDQPAWGALNGSVCGSGKRQSPINVATSDVEEGKSDLIDLVLTGWDTAKEGHFMNTGSSVKFIPNGDQSVATTMNHVGTYTVQQFHMHWGAMDSVGSEHRVDNEQTSAEIHFVQRKNDGNDTARNAYAVVGVRAVADSAAENVTGVWSDLDPAEVLHAEKDATIRYSDLLPSDLSYYYYEGSLTTPLCNEVVQWFLLRETVKVPIAYLERLRNVELDGEGNKLTFNYRDVQELNGRTVALHTDSSGISVRPLLSLLPLSLLAILLACM